MFDFPARSKEHLRAQEVKLNSVSFLSGYLFLHFSRNIVYLIAEYLKDASLPRSHSTLIDEAQLSNEFSVCDNVDLETIYLEFSSYFQIKFGKKPKFVKKVDQKVISIQSASSTDKCQTSAKKRSSLKTAPHVPTSFPNISIADSASSDCLRVHSLSPPTHDIESSSEKPSSMIYPKPMTNEDFYCNHPLDWKDMSEIIFKDVVKKDLCVKWDDVKGQEEAKMIIQESVIFPMKYPQLFGRVQPWKGRRNETQSRRY